MQHCWKEKQVSNSFWKTGCLKNNSFIAHTAALSIDSALVLGKTMVNKSEHGWHGNIYIYLYECKYKYKYQYIEMTFLATKVYPWNMPPVAESGVSEDIWTFETRALRSCKL